MEINEQHHKQQEEEMSGHWGEDFCGNNESQSIRLGFLPDPNQWLSNVNYYKPKWFQNPFSENIATKGPGILFPSDSHAPATFRNLPF